MVRQEGGLQLLQSGGLLLLGFVEGLPRLHLLPVAGGLRRGERLHPHPSTLTIAHTAAPARPPIPSYTLHV